MSQPAVASAAIAAALLAGCSAASPAATPSSGTSQAAPETAAAAETAAKNYFALYGAGQYAAIYPMILPADRAQISESVWVRLHQKCRNPAASHEQVTHPVLSGMVAVVTISLPGVIASLSKAKVTFTYSSGTWYYTPSDMSIYAHHTLAQAVSAATAAALC